jgi:hypothetical protein
MSQTEHIRKVAISTPNKTLPIWCKKYSLKDSRVLLFEYSTAFVLPALFWTQWTTFVG